MLELRVELVSVDEMAVLDGKPAMRICGVDKGDNSVERRLVLCWFYVGALRVGQGFVFLEGVGDAEKCC